MKTAAWTPPDFGEEGFRATVDEMVIFNSTPVKLNKSTTLLAALLIGSGYASMGLAFEILDTRHEELLVFVPGEPVKAVPELRSAILEIGLHVDHQVRNGVEAATLALKNSVMQQFDAVVDKEVQRRLSELNQGATVPADAAPSPASPSAVAPAAEEVVPAGDSPAPANNDTPGAPA